MSAHQLRSAAAHTTDTFGCTHPREPNRALLVMHIHQEEDDSRLEVASDVVDDEALSNVVDLDIRVVTSFDRFVAFLVVANAIHVCGNGLVRVPSRVLPSSKSSRRKFSTIRKVSTHVRRADLD